MREEELRQKLRELLDLPHENEIVEFKEAATTYEIEKLGRYFSALSNEASLRGIPFAWMIFGIRDRDKSLSGTTFRNNRRSLDAVKRQVSEHTNNGIGFVEIHEVSMPERIVMFQIPAASRGIPTSWKGHCFGRDGDGTIALSEEKRERIRRQNFEEDWSAEICREAVIDDLDPEAVALARMNFKNKFPRMGSEVDRWDDITFLNKARITIKGKVTRTAILLLGRPEAEHFISPAEAKIRWILKDSKGLEIDYQIESCPFILAVDKIYGKIRNLRYRYIKDETLFPEEVDRYEPYIIREAINNCIAHQDYTQAGRINVVEGEDSLIFSNRGSFIPGTVERVIKDDAPEEKYRNKFLATAMVNLNMVDTIGSGIKKMFNFQRQRFFPLPEYDFSDHRVKVTIIGKVLDMEYADVLAREESLVLEEIMMLDKVQKKKPLTSAEAKHLRKKGLIEGIKPNYTISAKLAQKIGQKAEYSKAVGFEKTKYFGLITNCIEQHGHVNRQDLNDLLWDVLPSWMSDKQKYTKISHLLAELRKAGQIKNTGSDYKPKWILVSENS